MIAIPKFKDLYDDILNDLQGKLSVTIPIFGKVFLRALAGVQAGVLKLCYITLGLVEKNTFPDNADSENSGGTLERWGRIKLGRNPNPAVSAVYRVSVTGTIGALISASTTFKSDDGSTNPGQLFIIDNNYTLVSTTDFINIRALTPGTVAKLISSDTLTATQPISSVDSSVIVQTSVTDPIDAEDIESYRTKVLNSFRLEPQGGAGTDYVLWAQDAIGIARVYPYAKSGVSNQINLYVEADASSSYDGDGTPTVTQLAAVQSVVEFDPDTTKPTSDRGRKPLTVIVNYLPVTIKYVDLQITGSMFTTDQKTVITAALTAFINTVRPFVASSDILDDKNDILSKNLLISTILNNISGGVFSDVIMNINSVPLSTYQFINGDIPYVNSIVYP